jgi:ubiquinone/menaquinone biosynthesis C-methylase UbiE
MRLFHRRPDPRAFATTMVGVKMGDRLLQIGCGDGRLLAALGAKVGLSGRAAGADPSAGAIARTETAAAEEGVLLELQQASPTAVPLEDGTFDVVVLHGVLPDVSPEARVAAVREAIRLLRAGGRCLVVDPATRGGLGALFGPRRDVHYQPDELLRSAGCKAVRVIAEQGGLLFVEGVKGG